MSEEKKTVAVVGGSGRKQHLAASVFGLAAAMAGPYSMQGFRLPKHRDPRPSGSVVCCAMCGRSGGTMRVTADKQRVCQKCYAAAKKEE